MSNPFKALQTRLDFTDKQAADYLGVPVFTFKKWRDGLREPSAAVNRLLDVLGTIEAIAPAIHAAFLPAHDESKIRRSRSEIQDSMLTQENSNS